MCSVLFCFLSDHDDVFLETRLYQQQDRDVLDQKSNHVHAERPAVHFRINLDNISPPNFLSLNVDGAVNGCAQQPNARTEKKL